MVVGLRIRIVSRVQDEPRPAVSRGWGWGNHVDGKVIVRRGHPCLLIPPLSTVLAQIIAARS